MTYSSLDKIPYKLFLKIEETGNVTLLSDSEIDIEILTHIWQEMYDEHLSKNQTSDSKKIFKISKNIGQLTATHKVVVMSCTSLRFEYNEDLHKIISDNKYKLSLENSEEYYNSLEQIERESEAYIIMAENYKGMLPDEEKKDTKGNYTIDDVMASYSNILGFDYDYDIISYTKFHSLQVQVNAKINALKKQNGKS